MARAYGLDLRRRVINTIDGGHVGAGGGGPVCDFDGDQLAPAREEGSLEPGRQGKPKGSKLDPHEAFIFKLIEEHKDIACHEIAETLDAEHGVRSCPATIWYFLDKRGLTHKKRRPTRASLSSRRAC